MLRSLLTSLALFIAGELSAQEIIHEEQIGWKGNNIELHTIRDKTGNQHASFLVNDDSIRIFLLNQQDSIIRRFGILRLNGEKIRGGFIDSNKLFLFCGYKFPHGLHNYVFDLTDGTSSQNLVLSDADQEKVIDRISAGNHFMYFSINKKTSEFVVYDWRNQNEPDTFRYHFADKNIWRDISESSTAFSRDVNIAKVDEVGVPDVEVAGNQNKLYLIHDTLFLLLNKNDGITKVFMFDTENKKVAYRKIINEAIQMVNYHVPAGRGTETESISAYGGYVDNSYLLDGKLYFISATPDRLNISISDFYTGTELKKFSVAREDTINFKNTAVIQEGQIYGFASSKELTKTKQLLRKMLAGNAVIAAMKDSSGIAVSVGSNKQMQQMGSGGSFMPMGGAPGAMTYVPSGGFTRSTWTKAVRFRMLLDSIRLTHIPGEIQTSINDQIEAFTADIKIPEKAENLFMQNGRYVYVYYDKKQRSLVFTRFSN